MILDTDPGTASPIWLRALGENVMGATLISRESSVELIGWKAPHVYFLLGLSFTSALWAGRFPHSGDDTDSHSIMPQLLNASKT
jgi:hypothetical protein